MVPGYRIVNADFRGKYIQADCMPLGEGMPAGPAVLYPGARKLKIKSVQKAPEGARLTFRGVPRSALQSGSVIVPQDWPVTESREILLFGDGKTLPGNDQEIRGGLHPAFNRESLTGPGRFKTFGAYVLLTFRRPFPVYPGAQLFAQTGPDRRAFTVFLPGRPDAEQMRRLNTAALRRPGAHPKPAEIYGRILHLQGFVLLPPDLRTHRWDGASAAGKDWVILNERREILFRKIQKAARKPGGVNQFQIQGFPDALSAAAAEELTSQGQLIRRGGWYFPAGEPMLSPFHRSWLEKVRASKEEGLRISSVRTEKDRQVLEELGRSGLIFGGRDMWLSSAAVESLSQLLLENYSPGDRIVMAEARSKLGGSRPGTLELLNILEAEGRLIPDGKERRLV